MRIASRIRRYVKKHGVRYTLHRACRMLEERVLRSYDRQWRSSCPSVVEIAAQRASQPDAGLISIVVPVYNTRPAFLHALVESFLAQSYENWEAVLYDGCSTDADTISAMAVLPDDPRLRLIHGRENAGISGNTNHAIALCRGEYVALCDHDDLLSPDALWRVANVIAQQHPDMIYSDEDRITEDGRIHYAPHIKPDFCPDNLRSGNYICHLMIVRSSLMKQLGGLRPDYDGSQDHDLTLRIIEATQRIAHIPRVLYHWRNVSSSVSHLHQQKCLDAAARAVTAHMERTGYGGCCMAEDGVLRLRWGRKEKLSVRTIRVPKEKRYAFMNHAASQSREDVLFFVDESVSDMTEGFADELLMYAQRDDVGAVTPMLTDRHGNVTHAGFALDDRRTAVCRNAGLPWHAGGWHGMNRTIHNVTAVSAACLMIRRDHFIPFDEGYCDGLGTVDWCLRLAQQGLRQVYTPHARAVCTESALLSSWQDQERFRAAWPSTEEHCCGRMDDYST